MPASRVSPLGAHLGYWLRFVSNHVSHAFARKVEAQGVSVAEWAVLRALYDADGAAPSAVAEKLGLTRGAITKIADKLLAKALVARRADADDRRFQALRLTAKGRALVPVLSALADRNDDAFFAHLPAGQRDALAAAMKALVRHHDLKAIPVD